MVSAAKARGLRPDGDPWLGRRFAPDPVNAGTGTVGGAIARNAGGSSAFRHGSTRDHLREVRLVFDTGECAADAGPRGREIDDALALALSENRELLEAHKPRTRFDRCGYHLRDVATRRGNDLAKLIAGSEGTLAFVTQATLRTVPLPGASARFVVGFASLEAAARAGAELRETPGIASADVLDQRLVARSRTGFAIPAQVAAALVATVEADTEREALGASHDAVARLRDRMPCMALAEPSCDADAVARVAAFHASAIAGLYALGRGRRPVPFIEDVAVPLAEVAGFLAAVQAELRAFDLTASFLIHALAGQVHTRPLIDLADAADRAKLWPLAEKVHAHALACGGTVSSQHGVGIARAPWVARQVPDLMPLFREVKRIFDPKNLLNPGKLTGPDPSRPAWPLRRVVESSRTPILLWQTPPATEAAKCNGCGDCRSRTVGRMCPAFRASGHETSSPRAMANLFAHAANLDGDDVREVASACIQCRMCADECRAKVDIPKLMLEAKAARFAAHGLHRGEWAFARSDALGAFAVHFAFTANVLLRQRPARWLAEKFLGLDRARLLPRFTHRTFLRRAWRAGLARKPVGPEPKLAYFVDTFANVHDPGIGLATVAVLRHHGYAVHVPWKQRASGLAPLNYGDVDAAREYAAYNVATFAELARDGYRIICSEPSAALMLTHDYPQLLPGDDARRVADATVELTTFLGRLRESGELKGNFRPLPFALGHHVPCHIKALHGPVAGPDLLAQLPGATVATIDAGCSGMAGTWGLRRANREASATIAAPMRAALAAAQVRFGSTECGACRMQIQHAGGPRTLHPVQYLALAYGLMPELEARLRRVPGSLLAD